MIVPFVNILILFPMAGWKESNDDHQCVGETGMFWLVGANNWKLMRFLIETGSGSLTPSYPVMPADSEHWWECMCPDRNGVITSCAGTLRSLRMSPPSESPPSSSGGLILCSTTSGCFGGLMPNLNILNTYCISAHDITNSNITYYVIISSLFTVYIDIWNIPEI